MISIRRLKEILERFKSVRIAVIGDMMLDEYLIGKVGRISPEAPVPVVNIEKERFVLGGASNVANNLISLSANVSVYGVVGNDANGEKFIKELEVKKINSAGIVKDSSRPTIIKSRVLAQGQQLLRLDWEKDIDISSENQDKMLELLKFVNPNLLKLYFEKTVKKLKKSSILLISKSDCFISHFPFSRISSEKDKL